MTQDVAGVTENRTVVVEGLTTADVAWLTEVLEQRKRALKPDDPTDDAAWERYSAEAAPHGRIMAALTACVAGDDAGLPGDAAALDLRAAIRGAA